MIRSIAATAVAVVCIACAKTTPTGAGIGEPCVGNGDCAAGFICASSRCSLPANLGGCEPNAARCNGADVEKCSVSGLGWDHVTTCATGCTAGACRPQVCTPGAARCGSCHLVLVLDSGINQQLVNRQAFHRPHLRRP